MNTTKYSYSVLSTEELDNYNSTDYFNSISGGLSIWSSFGRSIRQAGLNSKPFPVISTSTESGPLLSQHYAGLVVLAIFFSIVNMVVVCVGCCTRRQPSWISRKMTQITRGKSPPKAVGTLYRKATTSYKRVKKSWLDQDPTCPQTRAKRFRISVCAFMLLFISLFAFLVSLITSIRGNMWFTNSLGLIASGLLSSFHQASLTTQNVTMDVSTMYLDIESSFNKTTLEMDTFIRNFWDQTNGLDANVSATIQNMTQLQANLTAFIAKVEDTQKQIDKVSALAKTVSQGISDVRNLTTSYFAGRLNDQYGFFTLQKTLTPLNLTRMIPNSTNVVIPNIKEPIPVLNNLNFLIKAALINTTYAKSASQGSLIVANISSVMVQSLRLSKPKTMDGAKQFKENADKGLGDNPDKVDTLFKTTVNTADTAKNVIDGLLYAFGILTVLCCLLFVYFGKQKRLSHCLKASMALWTIVFWIGFIYLVLAVIMDDFCGVIFRRQGQGIDGLTYTGFAYSIQNVSLVRDQCSKKINLLRIASTLNLINYEQVNISARVHEAVDRADWVSLGVYLGQDDKATIISTDLYAESNAVLQASFEDTITRLATNETLQDIMSLRLPSQDEKDSIQNLTNVVNLSRQDFNFTVYYKLGPPTNETIRLLRVANITSSFYSWTSLLLTNLTHILDTTNQTSILSQFITERATLSSMLSDLDKNATELKRQTNALNVNFLGTKQWTQSFATITSGKASIFRWTLTVQINQTIPNFKSTCQKYGIEAQTKFEKSLECVPLSKSMFATENIVCSSTLLGLDSLWLGMMVMSIVGFILIPTYSFAGKIWKQESTPLEPVQVYPADNLVTKNSKAELEAVPQIIESRKIAPEEPLLQMDEVK